MIIVMVWVVIAALVYVGQCLYARYFDKNQTVDVRCYLVIAVVWPVALVVFGYKAIVNGICVFGCYLAGKQEAPKPPSCWY